MFEITYVDYKGAHHLIRFPDRGDAKELLNGIFYEAKLTVNGSTIAIGGVRPCKEHEKIRKNHKWFRWVDGIGDPLDENGDPLDFTDLLQDMLK